MNEGWKCPNCGKAHAPHVQTCPEPGTTDWSRVLGDPSVRVEVPVIGPAWPRPDIYVGDPVEIYGVGTWCVNTARTIFDGPSRAT